MAQRRRARTWAVAVLAGAALGAGPVAPGAQELPSPPEGVPFVPLYRTDEVSLAGFLDIRPVPSVEGRSLAVQVQAGSDVRSLRLVISGPRGRPSWSVEIGRTGAGEIEGRRAPAIGDLVRDGRSLGFALTGLPEDTEALRLERVVVHVAGGTLLGAPTPLPSLAGGGDGYELGLGVFGVGAAGGTAAADAPPVVLPRGVRDASVDLERREDDRTTVVLSGLGKVDRHANRPVVNQRAVVNFAPETAVGLQPRYAVSIDLATDAVALVTLSDNGQQSTRTLRARRSGQRLEVVLPASVDVVPGLLTALSAALQTDDGSGVVSSTPLVPVGALTGETPLPPAPVPGEPPRPSPTTSTTVAGGEPGRGEDGDGAGTPLVVVLVGVLLVAAAALLVRRRRASALPRDPGE